MTKAEQTHSQSHTSGKYKKNGDSNSQVTDEHCLTASAPLARVHAVYHSRQRSNRHEHVAARTAKAFACLFLDLTDSGHRVRMRVLGTIETDEFNHVRTINDGRPHVTVQQQRNERMRSLSLSLTWL